MRISICNELFQGWEWERTCDLAADLGYEGIEVAPFTFAARADCISAARRSQIASIAEQRGLSIVGLHWLLVGPSGLHITHPDREVRVNTTEYFKALIDLCADLRGNIIVIGSPKQRNLLPGVSTAAATGFAREVFEACLPRAEERSVTLALEPLGPKETTFIQTTAEAIELIEQINHPRFRMNVDVKAMSEESIAIPEIIRSAAPYLAHVQVNDSNLQGPGMGAVDYEPIVRTLREAAYDRWLSVEAFDFRLGAETIARTSINYLRTVLGQ
jgi:sugar phosphate isomerase/epimerase